MGLDFFLMLRVKILNKIFFCKMGDNLFLSYGIWLIVSCRVYEVFKFSEIVIRKLFRYWICVWLEIF